MSMKQKRRKLAAKLEFDIKDFEDKLSKLPFVMRQTEFKKALNKVGPIVKRAMRPLVPVGDPEHKPEKKALKDTLDVKVESYQDGRYWVVLVGPSWPAGAHGHLVEFGHEVRSRGPGRTGEKPLSGAQYVQGVRFIAPAADSTQTQQVQVIDTSIAKSIEKFEKGL